MRKCARCQPLRTIYPIKTPADLRAVFALVKEHLDGKAIVLDSYWPQGQARPMQPDFFMLLENRTWPDYFEYYFRCTACHQLFRLAVEAYHGSGGSWEPSKG